MNKSKHNSTAGEDSFLATKEKPASLISQILNLANRGPSTFDFMSVISGMLMDCIDCDRIELRVVERNKLLCCAVVSKKDRTLWIGSIQGKCSIDGAVIPCLDVDSDFERMCEDIIEKRIDISLPFYTKAGSFWLGDTSKPIDLSSKACKWAGGRTVRLERSAQSLAIIAFAIENHDKGFLLLESRRKNFFNPKKVRGYEEIAKIIGIALFQLRSQVALRERVKELTCLFGLSKLAATPNISIDQILQCSVELLPPGWLYPEHARARIIFDGKSFITPGFREMLQTQSADIILNGKKRGIIEVAYAKKMPELDEGPFLKEERSLIDAIAKELALIIESKQIEEDKKHLQEQLRHADRLATLGQLSAGIAHELNEPLATILGLSQLVAKNSDVPEQARIDNEKIISASLHAREVISKLRLFARQAPARKDFVNINDVIQDGLYILESRCAKAGIKLIKELDPDLPEIMADRGQLYQVLVNLVVNAVQATPDGGKIAIRTMRHDKHVELSVEDTGTGMNEEIKKHIFAPFFTTKDVDEGTGLGLAVVHGIVTSHGGRIDVESALDKGSRFEVRLPIVANKQDEE
jgi:signal transduction histidine kinase